MSTQTMTLACTYWPGAFTLSHLWLCEAMGCSPLGSSVHGIFPAKILEPVAISSSRESSQPRDWIWVSGSLELNSLLLSHQGSPYADLVDAFFFFSQFPLEEISNFVFYAWGTIHIHYWPQNYVHPRSGNLMFISHFAMTWGGSLYV